MSATAVNADGKTTSMSSTLRTLTPKDTANYTVIPSSGVVGVGMPVVIQFVSPVDTDKRAEVERRVKVTATPAVTGQWGWLDGRQLIFRPAKYWKPGTKVTSTPTSPASRPRRTSGRRRRAQHVHRRLRHGQHGQHADRTG